MLSTYCEMGVCTRIHSNPERLALIKLRNHEAELSIRCEVLQGGNGHFFIQIFDKNGEMIEYSSAEAWEKITFCLLAGCYTVRVFQSSGLNPGGITKWLRAEPRGKYGMCLRFSPQMRIPLAVPVSFTVSDADYSRPTALNGRIILKWRKYCMAASDYTISFLNGSSTSAVTLPVGTYTFVSTTIPGYETGSVSQFTVTPTTTSVALRITADGTLTVTVEDDLGAPITAGAFQLSNQSGDTRYGDEQNISNGTAVFPNVPYTAAGIDFYLAQDGSDPNHDLITTPQAVAMTQQAQTETVINSRKGVSPSFTIADENYAGITPVTGNLVIHG